MNGVQKKGSYKKTLRLFELISLGIGGTIGSRMFIVPGVVARIVGPGSIIAWLFALASAACAFISNNWQVSQL